MFWIADFIRNCWPCGISNAYEYDVKPEENAKELEIPFDLQAIAKEKDK
ncbi:hypothetical protein HYE25_00890 [Mycoplasmopsis bovis]|nr:hypothetical protein [Mycoplasmopsis bovis]QQH23403.1 hypothetical protein HYE25_00890 [Mycoplasmopsis bovis]